MPICGHLSRVKWVNLNFPRDASRRWWLFFHIIQLNCFEIVNLIATCAETALILVVNGASKATTFLYHFPVPRPSCQCNPRRLYLTSKCPLCGPSIMCAMMDTKTSGCDRNHFMHPTLGARDIIPNSKVHRTNMGPFWGRQDPGGPHVGPMNFAICDIFGLSQLSLLMAHHGLPIFVSRSRDFTFLPMLPRRFCLTWMCLLYCLSIMCVMMDSDINAGNKIYRVPPPVSIRGIMLWGCMFVRLSRPLPRWPTDWMTDRPSPTGFLELSWVFALFLSTRVLSFSIDVPLTFYTRTHGKTPLKLDMLLYPHHIQDR